MKMKKMKTQKTEISHLPLELLFNILSRLPLTSLLASAKCTCKLWRSIVDDDPIFPDLHVKQALNNPPGCLYAYCRSRSIYFADNPTPALKLPGHEHWYTCLASCHGLLSYQSTANDCIYICNPILGDRVKLPYMELPQIKSVGAFGYATFTKQYKYLHISFKKHHANGPFTAAGEIITLGEESWRDLPVPQGCVWTKSVYCNGALYSVYSEHCFMSFDLNTEKFRIKRMLPVDNRKESKLIISRYLTVLEETIVFVTQTKSGTQKVWVLVNEAEDVWIARYRSRVPTPDFYLSGIWMNQDMYGLGIFIGRVPGTMDYKAFTRCISYDVDHKTYTEIKLPSTNNEKRDISLQVVITHVGSLLSPSKIAKAAANHSCLVTR